MKRRKKILRTNHTASTTSAPRPFLVSGSFFASIRN